MEDTVQAQFFAIHRPDVIDERFDEEYVIVNLRTGTYYSLNATGARIWDCLNAGASRAAILQEMERRYDAPPGMLEQHLETLLKEMEREQLIVAENKDASSASATGTTFEGERIGFVPPHMEKYTDMQALLLLDPIHQVDDTGWPSIKPNVP